MRITFLGGAGTVTGSKYLLETLGRHFLIDCGLFQGQRDIRDRNWQDLPVSPAALSAVVLTHAHLDHSGYLPLLVKKGFRGPVYCTKSTAELLNILLPDCGHLQEKDAEFANRHGYSKHKPALPLYTERDARNALELLVPIEFERKRSAANNVEFIYRRAGHILGAASIELQSENRTILFSGDVGRYGDPILPDPTPIKSADYLLVESTYGDRQHEKIDPQKALSDTIGKTVARGGTVVIPAFAVGRAQTLLFYIQRLRSEGALTNVPVFLDSPMAVDASEIFCHNMKDHRLAEGECRRSCAVATYIRSTEESKALTRNPMPKVIISASGMATGGRVVHHLKRYASDARNTILFAGFQAPGTRGAEMVAGTKVINIHGEHISVRAQVENLSTLSAHADADEILRWLHGFGHPPAMTFMVHGEAQPTNTLASRIERELGWPCRIPKYLDAWDLEAKPAVSSPAESYP
ncbi:MAG: MBL fold metallo-hydrolase [Xanthobacteraceae bacterium]|nr:MBL fold metallo-hydrolase [Xanthobacteraceae bacterium]